MYDNYGMTALPNENNVLTLKMEALENIFENVFP